MSGRKRRREGTRSILLALAVRFAALAPAPVLAICLGAGTIKLTSVLVREIEIEELPVGREMRPRRSARSLHRLQCRIQRPPRSDGVLQLTPQLMRDAHPEVAHVLGGGGLMRVMQLPGGRAVRAVVPFPLRNSADRCPLRCLCVPVHDVERHARLGAVPPHELSAQLLPIICVKRHAAARMRRRGAWRRVVVAR
ncbi:hypothetical protein DFH09DRAFT_1109185 [Mycena vulgaris]|nr:hypothetical protein DFH09DRAFT_1109185 [Mycena vulgaris]